ncbi:MAG: cytochrome P450 [Rhodococcus sp. (in: high G+C Gram-positive bacteria)]|uniref:cytochrome P450 n=1 Tax=Rhodococcus sp. TaxID=1831 RepID=UPI002ADA94BC|nr:cytochrome P450 [Rhodococcus sp. (in: high G+C Gram-positive bacteria)]
MTEEVTTPSLSTHCESPPPARRLGTVRTTLETLAIGLDPQRGLIGRLAAAESTRWRLGTRRYLTVNHPDAIDHVLHKGRLKYVKSAEYEPVRAAAGINLLTDEGESWAAHRGVLNPMFAKRHLNQIFDLMVDPVVEMADRRAGQSGRVEFDVHAEMVTMTLRVVANSLYSQDFGAVVDNMHDLATKGLRAGEVLLRLGLVGALPKPMWKALTRVAYSPVPVPPPFAVIREVARGLDEAVTSILDERLAHPTSTPDLLNMLLDADDGTWPRQRVRDEALVFIMAGHETTANALSWFWYLMALNPAARERMLAEVDAVLGDRRIAVEDLARLPWTTACVQESQRYYSAVPMVVRTAIEDDVVAGHHVRKGTTVFIPINVVHHDPRFWSQPAEFDPTRFLPGAPRPHRSAFLPFGGGRRACIGQSFALMEMVAIAATLSQRFVFDLVPGHPVELVQSLTVRPKHGIRVVSRRRDSRAVEAAPADPSGGSCPVTTSAGPATSTEKGLSA